MSIQDMSCKGYVFSALPPALGCPATSLIQHLLCTRCFPSGTLTAPSMASATRLMARRTTSLATSTRQQAGSAATAAQQATTTRRQATLLQMVCAIDMLRAGTCSTELCHSCRLASRHSGRRVLQNAQAHMQRLPHTPHICSSITC